MARGGRTDDRWAERRDRLIIGIAACLGIGGAALGHWLTVVAMAYVLISPVIRLDRRYGSDLAGRDDREESDEERGRAGS